MVDRRDLKRIKNAVQGFENNPRNEIQRTQYKGGLANGTRVIKLTDSAGSEPFYSWVLQQWDTDNDELESSDSIDGDYDSDNNWAYDINKNPDLPNEYVVDAFRIAKGGWGFRSDRQWTATVLTVASNVSFTATLRYNNAATAKTISVTNLATSIDVAAGKRIYVYWNGVNWEMCGYAC